MANNKLLKLTHKGLVSFGRILSKNAIKLSKKGFKLSKTAFKLTRRLILRRKCCETKKKGVKFSYIVIEVNPSKSGWQQLVNKMLKTAEGVRQCQMDGRGFVLISGKVEPNSILKALEKLGRKVILHDWRFGDCSTNLFGPSLAQYTRTFQ